jgi:hypothetical protein
MEKIIFAVVLLHLIAGFGWVVYKLQFQKREPKEDEKEGTDNL